MSKNIDRRLSVAPMMDWTDRFYRYFARCISKQTLLYTEMVTTGALLNGDRDYLLAFDDFEHPIALQLGGSSPHDLASCCKIGEEAGYDEINLNLGCPSDRVQSGRFGACLMAEPQLVSELIQAMNESCSLPITAKTRIGIDEQDSYDELCIFIDSIRNAGTSTFIIHARKAWLQGLSPKQNREIPPIRYDIVYQLKKDFPELEIIINGGIQTISEAQQHLEHCDGVMIGRAAYHTPWILSEADKLIFKQKGSSQTPYDVIQQMIPFIEQQLSSGIKLHTITRHMLGLFHGRPGAKAWRRYLSEKANSPEANIQTLIAAASSLSDLTV